MRSATLFTTLLALGLASAIPLTFNPKIVRPRQAAPAPMDATCAQASILAQGIALNIADQEQELSTANAMAAMLQANPVDSAAWAQSRTNLLQFINNGIAIRESNQLITPAQSKATAGVATVANAQLQELGLATNLTAMGSDDVQGNLKIVQTLQMDFSGGIMQNQKNMADILTQYYQAMAGCGAAGGAAAPAPAPAAAPAPASAPAPAAAPKPSSAAGAAPAAKPSSAAAGSSTANSTTGGATGGKGAGKANFASKAKTGMQTEGTVFS
ncbi:hypothetical protein N0V82_002415 [Gnomoniopsis sp. IMI 355080]|nr:hypothetical protein N0V82_002415 [Gnomoniopsis sp. IMI 355080]